MTQIYLSLQNDRHEMTDPMWRRWRLGLLHVAVDMLGIFSL
jgi:hypothetical protein